MPERSTELKAPLFASLSLAFASFGDAFLYPFLPVNHAAVGVPLVWMGTLLSVNRFVRIFSNAWMVRVLSMYGLRAVAIMAAVLAILSTAGYAVAQSLWLWLLLRVIWGLAFSAMRITTAGYALQHPQQGFVLGITRGVQEAGPMVALMVTPVVIAWFGARETFLVFALLSLPAIYFAWKLPRLETKTPVKKGGAFLRLPSLVDALTFASSFIIDGVLVVVLGILFLHCREDITPLVATSLAAFYLGYRRVCLVLFSPVGGWLSDKLGAKNIYHITWGIAMAGLVLLTFGWIEAGAVVTFLFYSVHAAVTPVYVAHSDDYALHAIAVNATWRDVGAAVGTLVGGILISSTHLNHLLLSSIFVSLILFLFQWSTAQRALKMLYLWK